MLCQVEIEKQKIELGRDKIDFLSPIKVSLEFPEKYGKDRVDEIRCKLVRVQGIKWESKTAIPSKIEIAVQFIDFPSEQSKERYFKILDSTEEK